MDYYERKRQAIEATIAEIHKAQSAYRKQTEEINYTAKGLANLEFKIKKLSPILLTFGISMVLSP